MCSVANLAALVEYDGTRYKGFQRQSAEKGPTVQGALEAAIARVAGEVVTSRQRAARIPASTPRGR